MTPRTTTRLDNAHVFRRKALHLAAAGSLAALSAAGIRSVSGQEATPESTPGAITIPDTRAEVPHLGCPDHAASGECRLDRAIATVNDQGGDVSRDDWVFPNRDPSQDCADADYEAL